MITNLDFPVLQQITLRDNGLFHKLRKLVYLIGLEDLRASKVQIALGFPNYGGNHENFLGSLEIQSEF